MISTLYIGLNVLLFLIGITNYNTLGGQLIISGVVNNQIVITSNNFKMPVYDPYIESNFKSLDDLHIINPKKQNFPFLSDWILIPDSINGGTLDLSPGDIEIISGIQILTYDTVFKK